MLSQNRSARSFTAQPGSLISVAKVASRCRRAQVADAPAEWFSLLDPSLAFSTEERQLIAAPLRQWIDAEVRLQVCKIQGIRRQECARVVPLEEMPVTLGDCGAENRRAIQLVANELGSLGRNQHESNDMVVLRDAAMAPKDRFGEHRGPLDLEQHRRPAPDIPDAVDRLEILRRRPGDERQVDVPLAIIEPIDQPPISYPPALLTQPDPDLHPQPVTAAREGRKQLAVLLGSTDEVLGGEHPIVRARPAAIALQACPDERLVGQVMTSEERCDPLEE